MLFHKKCVIALLVILKRHIACIVTLVIDGGSGNSVHIHLNQISLGHSDRNDCVFLSFPARLVVRPVLIMVLVSSLMMDPRFRIPFLLPFGIVGTSVSLIVFSPGQELRRTVLAKIMS